MPKACNMIYKYPNLTLNTKNEITNPLHVEINKTLLGKTNPSTKRISWEHSLARLIDFSLCIINIISRLIFALV